MTAALRRGTCPSLAAPMLTGDGWLARLAFTGPLTGAQLAGIADVAWRLGNGLIEVTARGSLQIRGLGEGAPLAEALAPLDLPLAEGLPVAVSPLAGLDPEEQGDPRPLAAALRVFPEALPPKVAVVVDGGGRFSLDAVAADVRLKCDAGGWRVGVGGTTGAARWMGGTFGAEAAVTEVRGLLWRMSREGCRGRELHGIAKGLTSALGPLPASRAVQAVGRFGLMEDVARGVGLPFGVAGSAAVAALAGAADAARFCPAPGRVLVVLGLPPGEEAGFADAADRLGFVIEAGDARLAIAACSGAPACGSGRLATRAVAARIAAERPGVAAGVRLHLSGCAKRCAQPSGPAVTLEAGAAGPRVTGDGRAVPPGLERYLLEAAAW